MPARRNKRWIPSRDAHLVTEVPRPARCPQCHRAVLGGHLGGVPNLYDPQHLSPKGEGEALIRRLRTFRVTLDETHLSPRRPYHILKEPRPRWGYIIRQHRCTAPDPDPRGVLPPETPFDYDDPGF